MTVSPERDAASAFAEQLSSAMMRPVARLTLELAKQLDELAEQLERVRVRDERLIAELRDELVTLADTVRQLETQLRSAQRRERQHGH